MCCVAEVFNELDFLRAVRPFVSEILSRLSSLSPSLPRALRYLPNHGGPTECKTFGTSVQLSHATSRASRGKLNELSAPIFLSGMHSLSLFRLPELVHIISRAASRPPFLPRSFSSFYCPPHSAQFSFCPQIGLGRHRTLCGVGHAVEVLYYSTNRIYVPRLCPSKLTILVIDHMTFKYFHYIEPHLRQEY